MAELCRSALGGVAADLHRSQFQVQILSPLVPSTNVEIGGSKGAMY
jgi:hypothetical protein